MDRKLSDIKKLEILKKQVEARKIQISKGMNKRQLISIVITLAILVCVFAYIILKYQFSDSEIYRFIQWITVWKIFCGVLCYSSIIAIVCIIYKFCNAITTRILNKHVKSASIRELISIICTIIAYVFAYAILKYKFTDSWLYKFIEFIIGLFSVFEIISAMIIVIVYIITTIILNKHVKSASKRILFVIIITLPIFAYVIIKYKFGVYITIGAISGLISSTIFCVIAYVIFQDNNAKNNNSINSRILNKPVKSVNIMKLISIIIGFGLIIFGLTKLVSNDKYITKNRDRYVVNTIYGAILGDKMDNYQEDYEKTKDDVYVAKIKSRIDPNAVLSVKFSRKAILWPYTAVKYLVRHVIGSMMVRLKYPVFVLPKDLNSGVYPYNLEPGSSEILSIFSIGFTENDIIQATRINQLPLNERKAFLIAEKNNIRVYKEHPKDIQGIRYIIPKNLPNQKHSLIIQYNYHKKNSAPKLWGYGQVGGQSEFTIKTSLSPNFIVEYKVWASRTAKQIERVKQEKLNFGKNDKPVEFSKLYSGGAINNLYDLIINTRDVIEIKDRLIDKPEKLKELKKDPNFTNDPNLYYTEISADHPELLVDHPEIFAKIVEYNEKFIAYLKTIAIETHNGKELKDDVTIYRVVGDELKQMQFDLKKEVEITNKDNKEGNK